MDNEKEKTEQEQKPEREPELNEEPEGTESKPEEDNTEEELSGKEKKKLGRRVKELEAKLSETDKLLEKTNAVIAESNDKYLRLLAEFDNYKKRTAKENEARYANAYADAVEALLPVFDNIERAVDYASDEQSRSGLQIIVNNFKDTLAKMGVEQFGARGDEFNADLHSAVMHVEDKELGENTIAEVFLKGYKKGDKIIRYATVKVAN